LGGAPSPLAPPAPWWWLMFLGVCGLCGGVATTLSCPPRPPPSPTALASPAHPLPVRLRPAVGHARGGVQGDLPIQPWRAGGPPPKAKRRSLVRSAVFLDPCDPQPLPLSHPSHKLRSTTHPSLAPHARSTTTCRSALVGFVDFDTVDNALRAQKDYDGTRPAGTNSCRLSESWVNCVTPVPHPPRTIPPSRAGLPTLLPGAPRVHCPAACFGRPCPSRPILHERGQTTSGSAQAQVRCAGRQRPARHGQPVAPTVPQAWG
jgi:hypothetical protein